MSTALPNTMPPTLPTLPASHRTWAIPHVRRTILTALLSPDPSYLATHAFPLSRDVLVDLAATLYRSLTEKGAVQLPRSAPLARMALYRDAVRHYETASTTNPMYLSAPEFSDLLGALDADFPNLRTYGWTGGGAGTLDLSRKRITATRSYGQMATYDAALAAYPKACALPAPWDVVFDVYLVLFPRAAALHAPDIAALPTVTTGAGGARVTYDISCVNIHVRAGARTHLGPVVHALFTRRTTRTDSIARLVLSIDRDRDAADVDAALDFVRALNASTKMVHVLAARSDDVAAVFRAGDSLAIEAVTVQLADDEVRPHLAYSAVYLPHARTLSALVDTMDEDRMGAALEVLGDMDWLCVKCPRDPQAAQRVEARYARYGEARRAQAC